MKPKTKSWTPVTGFQFCRKPQIQTLIDFRWLEFDKMIVCPIKCKSILGVKWISSVASGAKGGGGWVYFLTKLKSSGSVSLSGNSAEMRLIWQWQNNSFCRNWTSRVSSSLPVSGLSPILLDAHGNSVLPVAFLPIPQKWVFASASVINVWKQISMLCLADLSHVPCPNICTTSTRNDCARGCSLPWWSFQEGNRGLSWAK
jgi:hypothetical protein